MAIESLGRVVLLACALSATLLCRFDAAYAQDLTPEERAAGEKLYEDGSRLLEEKRYTEACPLLERALEVVRRQGVGGILALAECREGEGKIASAWTLYREAASKAQQAGQPDRVQIAKEGEARVAPDIHYVAVTNGAALAAIEGVAVSIQGKPVAPVILAAPVAVDPGAITIEVRAPGHAPGSVTIEVPKKSGTTAVAIELGAETASVVPPPRGERASDERGLAPVTIAGIVVGSVGAAAAIAGGVLFAVAKSSYPDGCETGSGAYDSARCGAGDAYDDAESARSLGDVSAGVFYPGVGLLAVGVVMTAVGLATSSGDAGGDGAAPVAIVPGAVGADAGGLSLRLRL